MITNIVCNIGPRANLEIQYQPGNVSRAHESKRREFCILNKSNRASIKAYNIFDMHECISFE